MLCPELEKDYNIITRHNMDALLLSTYLRYPGIQVRISCLTPSVYQLVGHNTLICQRNGTWNKDAPKCKSRKQIAKEKANESKKKAKTKERPIITVTPGSVTPSPISTSKADRIPSGESLKNSKSTASEDALMLFSGSITPYVITVCVLAIMFLCLVFIMTYLVRLRNSIDRKVKEIEIERRPAHVRAVDSLRSLHSDTSAAYDYFQQNNSPALSGSASSNSSNRRNGRTQEAERGSLQYTIAHDRWFPR